MNYKNINGLSWPVYRGIAFYDTDSTYNIEYHCEAAPWSKLSESVWRIKRVRYLKTNDNWFDTTWAINDFKADSFDYLKWTSEFIFWPITESYVKALDFTSNPD